MSLPSLWLLLRMLWARCSATGSHVAGLLSSCAGPRSVTGRTVKDTPPVERCAPPVSACVGPGGSDSVLVVCVLCRDSRQFRDGNHSERLPGSSTGASNRPPETCLRPHTHTFMLHRMLGTCDSHASPSWPCHEPQCLSAPRATLGRGVACLLARQQKLNR